MNRLLVPAVAILFLLDLLILGSLERPHAQAPPDLTPRVAQLEKDLGQAQADIGELKQEIQLLQHRGGD